MDNGRGSGDAPIVVVTGLTFEARIAGGAGVRVICQQNATLAATVEAVVAQGCRGIVSFGTAGGLIDALRPGAWVLARAVVVAAPDPQPGKHPVRRYHADSRWSESLLHRLEHAHYADIAGVVAPVVTAESKRRLARLSGAAATDMESHIVAAIAADRGLPFVCARVVIDPVERTLPPAAIAALSADGSTDIGAVLRSLIRQPTQLPSLLSLARDARTARRALAKGRKEIGPAFGFPDRGR
jgi:hopanoid-associated phosphorylase